MATEKKASKAKKSTASRARSKKAPAKKRAAKKPAASKSRRKATPAPDPGLLYRRIALGFVACVVLLLAVVIYLSTVRAVVSIVPTQQKITSSFEVQTVEVPLQPGEVRGVVRSGALGRTETFEASSEETIEELGVARGEIVIKNTSSRAQPLIATTRFLSDDGALFRLEDGVTVPAGGEVVAQVYADQEGAAGDIGPARFTIPGLNATRQKQIYGESTSAMQGGLLQKRVLGQAEIDAAKETLLTSLLADGQAMVLDEVGALYSGSEFTHQILEEAISASAGDQVETFDVTLTVRIQGVFYDNESLVTLAEQQLYTDLGQGWQFRRIATEPEVQVLAADEDAQTATLGIEISGVTSPSRTSPALRPERLVGMTEEEVAKTLKESQVATEVSVSFFPFWIKKIPAAHEHVSIELLD